MPVEGAITRPGVDTGPQILERAADAIAAAEAYGEALRRCVATLVAEAPQAPERHQRAQHLLAWTATTVRALREMQDCASAWDPDGLILRILVGEYLAQVLGGLPMGQNEIGRPRDAGAEAPAEQLRSDPAVAWFLANGNTAANRAALAERLLAGWRPDQTLDADCDAIRNQVRRFTEAEILPFAQAWHRADALIPDAVITRMAELGLFGLCIPVEHGGMGLGKLAMCVATEELSRGWIAAGSLGTRAEIAGELIATAGTPAQRARWLPAIARGEVLPAAVFTEPDTGSDLAALTTRARRQADDRWRFDGAKTWITHAARSDLMTILARSEPEAAGQRGLSMFLAPKQRATEAAAFPDEGLAGSDIPVLGYRGMREYALSFDGFTAPADSLLGGHPGEGFKQLMRTFESARIQTAARATGVAWRAFELGFGYACERVQFGRRLVSFPRVADKLVLSVVETLAAAALTYRAARLKDAGGRCDVAAGMAKLLGARVAWTNADAALQVHGGNGYALEYEISRVLCDARILSIFEGAAEIQAQVIAKGLLVS